MASKLMRWEVLEIWLFDYHTHGGQFTVYDVAAGLGITTASASRYIQAYLTEQRSPESTALYVLHREGRTASAVWMCGERTVDARAVANTYYDDVKTKWRRAAEPDISRIAARNPRARKTCDAIMEAVSDHAMELMRIATGSIGDDDDNDAGGVPA